MYVHDPIQNPILERCTESLDAILNEALRSVFDHRVYAFDHARTNRFVDNAYRRLSNRSTLLSSPALYEHAVSVDLEASSLLCIPHGLAESANTASLYAKRNLDGPSIADARASLVGISTYNFHYYYYVRS